MDFSLGIEYSNGNSILYIVVDLIFYLDMEHVEKVCQSLVNSHHRYCVWKFMIIPESIVQLTDIYSNETVNRILKEAEEFLLRIIQIDIVGQLSTVCFI